MHVHLAIFTFQISHGHGQQSVDCVYRLKSLYRARHPFFLCMAHSDPNENKSKESDDNEVVRLKKFSKCKIFSSSQQAWYVGQIIGTSDTIDDGERYLVRYKVGNEFQNKKVRIGSKSIQAFDYKKDFDKISIFCICGEKLRVMTPAQCYAESFSNSNMAKISCDICGEDIIGINCYHCPKEESPKHDHGYDLCQNCALTQIGHITETNLPSKTKNENTNENPQENKEKNEQDNPDEK